MRRALSTFFIAVTLLAAAPASAAAPEKPFHAEIGRHFMTGARFYAGMVGSWTSWFLWKIGVSERFAIVGAGQPCTQKSRCAAGLVCINRCQESECLRFEKLCSPSPGTVSVLGPASICGAENLCADGTDCLRVCPVGANCAATHRCVKTKVPGNACASDLDCKAACGSLEAPEIGPAAYVARCSENGCTCVPVEINPGAARVACAPDKVLPALACPTGTHQACAAGNAGSTIATCLIAPALGGSCFDQAECADAACPENTEPFCDESRACKCRSTQATTIACTQASDCSAAACGMEEIAACIDGACACAPAGRTSACAKASDCSNDCPEGFRPACVDSACACQRTQENVPVACQSVADCGSVSCPAAYEKTCLNAVCACTRTSQPR